MITVGAVTVCAVVSDVWLDLDSRHRPCEIDGVSVQPGESVLLVGQRHEAENGVHLLGTDFRLRRFCEWQAVDNVMVSEGTMYGDTMWALTTNEPIVPGTTRVNYGQHISVVGSEARADHLHTWPAASVVECQRCGADLPRPDAAGYTDCKYCGALNATRRPGR